MWTNAFVGLPWLDRGRDWKGVDCWGLLYLVYQTKGIAVQSYSESYTSATEREQVALLAQDANKSPWLSVERGQEQSFDMLFFRRGRLATHVGVVTARGKMLHICEGREAVIDRYDLSPWSVKLCGIYRHEAMT